MGSAAFSVNPAFTPIPTAGAWIYSNIVQNGNTHSNTTLDTLVTGTSFLAVGQPVSGSGIPAGTTIASITNATSLVLSQAATTTVSVTPITFGANPQLQSAFSNNVNYGIPAISLTDVPGCDFAIPETQTIVAGASFVIAPGAGYFSVNNGATTGSTLQIQTAAGTWTTIFTATVSVVTFFGGILVCDGGNVRFTAAGATNPSFTFYRFRQWPNL
jgi:hypothetical protein